MPQNPKSFLRIIAIFTACILLAACATVQISPQTIGDPKYKIINNPDSPYKTAAGQLLEKLVKYIEPIENQEDVTVEGINKAFDLDLKASTQSENFWGKGRPISDEWWYTASLSKDSADSTVLTFFFTPAKGLEQTNPIMEPVCEMDADEFSKKLQAIGFSAGAEIKDGSGWYRYQGRAKGNISVRTHFGHNRFDTSATQACFFRALFFIQGA